MHFVSWTWLWTNLATDQDRERKHTLLDSSRLRSRTYIYIYIFKHTNRNTHPNTHTVSFSTTKSCCADCILLQHIASTQLLGRIIVFAGFTPSRRIHQIGVLLSRSFVASVRCALIFRPRALCLRANSARIYSYIECAWACLCVFRLFPALCTESYRRKILPEFRAVRVELSFGSPTSQSPFVCARVIICCRIWKSTKKTRFTRWNCCCCACSLCCRPLLQVCWIFFKPKGIL